MTTDYKRHGTTTLFAALEILHDKAIGQCHARHRHQLNLIERWFGELTSKAICRSAFALSGPLWLTLYRQS